ncbi:putative protease Do-like 14 [Silene latifolia]|uniref:putative protease Do-like 14 n=1 Tax=Silene latifolia TaxID=37657 RepID=UPI003D7725C9
MASPGFLSMERHDPKIYDCTELLTVSRCPSTSRCGDGAPVVNLSGEVFSITYYDVACSSPFLPINIAYKWWNHYKQFKEMRHPSYGFEGSHLYSAILPFIENFLAKFPNITDGVRVMKVLQGSYAQTAGLLEDDVIVKCDGKSIKSFLELWNWLFEKVGDAVELQVVRVSLNAIENISMVVGDATPNELNKWPRYH